AGVAGPARRPARLACGRRRDDVGRGQGLRGLGRAGGDGLAVPLFDLVLIDEASQMMLAQGLLSLAGLAEHGRVLVAGEHRRLPPIRPTSDALEPSGRMLGGSLYGFLKSAGVSEFRL